MRPRPEPGRPTARPAPRRQCPEMSWPGLTGPPSGGASARPMTLVPFALPHHPGPMAIDETRTFIPVSIAVMTVSDTRTREDDVSGDTLERRIRDAGHSVVERTVVADDANLIAAQLKRWIASP